MQHYLQRYSKDTIITDEALANIDSLPVLTELDTEPTQNDLSKAADSLTDGKAHGIDAIPLLQHLNELALLCWKRKRLFRTRNIVQNKGDRCDFNNYRDISLLGVVGNVFAAFPRQDCRSSLNALFLNRSVFSQLEDRH